MPARILVIDDDPKVTVMLRRGLGYEGYTVDTAHGGQEGLQLAREHSPDLVVLDIMMPGMDGLEVCRRFRAEGNVPVLMLTARDGVADRVVGLNAGADDYLVKPFAFEELLARVRALLRRGQVPLPEKLEYGDLLLDTGSRRALRQGQEVKLTTTEYRLLELFLRHPHQVLPKEMLLERVWGYDFGGDSNVLEVYIRYLRNKLEAAGGSRLIHTMRGSGYVLRQE
ncbi:MAG: response regulator transcription factor [Chloroflexi bacterium]|nr:response regulator transcription factor [Chloroflexota bacterium]